MAAIMPHSLPGEWRQGSSAPATFRAELSDGLATTVHLAAYDLARTEVRVVALPQAEPLASWCGRTSVAEALVGGFFLREQALPLGELRLGGIEWESVPFMSPWNAVRSCVHIEGGELGIARRETLPLVPRGDLLQAGPLLVERGRIVVHDGVDPEGFSAGCEQFDSDITAGRHPRAALGVQDGLALSVTCDGRNAADAGLTLGELAELMHALGAHDAINLDGGGSATQVCGTRIVNRPRELDGTDIRGGRPIYTALAFTPRTGGAFNGQRPDSLALA
ncbi:MAG TPA: phosphodiester glycosidase family protein [Solirubrobacterales bacterium]|nr:phosphodiester glycosidase family protein [Solirubrobacterales bacterium]